MIQIRVGLPRTTRHNCLARYTIQYVNIESAKQQLESDYTSLENKTISCHNHSSNSPITHKFSLDDLIGLSSVTSQKFRTCVTLLNDFGTNKTLIQLKLSSIQKKPFNQSLDSYVNEHQVYEFEILALSIQKQIILLRNYIEQCQDILSRVQKIMKEQRQAQEWMSVLQIFGLIVYGVSWIVAVWSIWGSQRRKYEKVSQTDNDFNKI